MLAIIFFEAYQPVRFSEQRSLHKLCAYLLYDGVDHLTNVTYPGGQGNFTYSCCMLSSAQDANTTAEYTYNGIGRLTQWRNQDNKTISYAYDTEGNVVQVTYPDNKNVTYAYDADNRLITIKKVRPQLSEGVNRLLFVGGLPNMAY